MSHLDRDGERLVYETRGPGGAPVVLCVHNLLTDRTIFADVVARLGDRARVVLVDLRGHGESTARRPFSSGDLGGDLLAVLDAAAAPSAIVVGVSLGATAAIELALQAPERVQALLLMGVNAQASTRADAVKNTLLGAIVRALGWRSWIVATARDVLFGRSFQAARPDVLAVRLARIAAMERRAAWFSIRCWVGRRPLLERLAALRVPTVVVAGEEDLGSPPAQAEEAAARIPGARLERMRAGHTVPLEQPEAVACLIEGLLPSVA